jgi:tRNA splicing endonuclease
MSDVVNFDKIVGQIKDLAELQAYADAQYKTIVDLNKKINELKDKNQSLEYAAAALAVKPSNVVEFPALHISAEEEICLKQLENLRGISSSRDLTLEEARRLEIYAKILIQIRSNIKDVDGKFKKMSTDDLLKLTQEVTSESK